jgi:iron complex outermembrane receptor protein
MKKLHYAVWAASSAALTLGMCASAFAQESSSTLSSATGSTLFIEEVVITANKREQNMNDVGSAVSAIGVNEINEQRIRSIEDLTVRVPSLKFSESGAGTPIYTLRGIGFNEESLGVAPAVSVYTDEIPLPFPVLTLRSGIDLERIEVLKGPQGILFGQNSTGGAINYIAAKPTDTFEYGGDISFGGFDAIDGSAFISGPISDNVAARLAIQTKKSDGWQRSLTRPSDRNGAEDYVSSRLTFTYDPGDNFRLRATALAWQDKSEPQAAQLIAVRAQNPADTQASLLAAPFGTSDPRTADWTTTSGYVVFTDVANGDFSINPQTTSNLTPRSDRTFAQGALRAEYDIGDSMTLTSLTSFLDYDQSLYSDKDGAAQAVANIGDGVATIESFQQELRLANSNPDRFNWVMGANYEDSSTFEDQFLTFANGSSSSPNTLFINTTGSIVNQDITNYAFFANGEYQVFDDLIVKLGGRYTNSSNDAELCAKGNGDGLVSTLFNIVGGFSGNSFTPIGVDDCYVLNAQGVPGDVIYDTLDEDNFSWRVGVDYIVNPDTLVYANLSKGFKAGSFPTLASADYLAYRPVTQESVLSYEAGIKVSLADRRAQLNGSIFYYDYVDKQIRGKVVDPIFDVLDTLINVPKSKVFGAEVDLTMRLTDGLSLTTALTYLDSEVKTDGGAPFVGPSVYGNNCTDGSGNPGPCDFTGSDLPFTPELSYSQSISYRRDVGDGTLFMGANIYGQTISHSALNGGKINFRGLENDRNAPNIDQPFSLPKYTLVDARIGYEFGDGRYKVMFWGKNIFNKYYVTNANHFLDTTVRFAGNPRTYGLTLNMMMD